MFNISPAEIIMVTLSLAVLVLVLRFVVLRAVRREMRKAEAKSRSLPDR